MKRIKALIIVVAMAALPSYPAIPATKAEKEKMDKFVSELISRMTLDEKIGQLNLPPGEDIQTGDAIRSNLGSLVASGKAGGTFNVKGASKVLELQKLAVEKTRLGIPLLIGMDVVHGYETVFPIPFALSASWDIPAIENSARIAAKEASAAGINWTFSPMVDISREPRWGRMAEGAGEDPYLGSRIAEAMVRGYQGDRLKGNDEIMACVKHFALYGAPDAGRDYNTVDMSRVRMYNDYLAPYKAAADAGAGSFMSSFNLVDYVPATANKWLLTDLLRDQWGFKGFVVTDYGSINEMKSHGMGEGPENTVRALKAGTDMDMSSNAFIANLADAVGKGIVSEAEIDKALRRVLEAKYMLGLFDNPYKYNDVGREKNDIYTEANRKAARDLAAETFVLLRNEGKILPIEKKGKIALIGPLANTSANMCGTWSVAADFPKYKTLLQGFRDAVGDKAEIRYAKGSNVYSDKDIEAAGSVFGRDIRDPRSEEELLNEAVAVANEADVIVAAMGETSECTGEAACRTDLSIPDTQRRLLEALITTGKPLVLINFSGRPTVMTWESENIPAIMNVWFAGSEGADAIADVVFGEKNPSGKLTATMPRNVGQIPIHYNHMRTGRPATSESFQKFRSNYIDSGITPLYPFGFGLSYTDFTYGKIELDSDRLSSGGEINASVTVTNSGDRAGDEIVQFYISDPAASLARPVKELKYFERISLKPGESRKITFPITAENLKFYNSDLEYVAEPGLFRVMAGPDSERLSSAEFTLVE